MKRKSYLVALCVLSALLTGCSSLVEIKVTAFHLLGPEGHGNTFWVLPLKDSNDRSVESATYAVQVSEELKRRGWVKIMDPKTPPNFTVWMDYGIDSGRDVAYTIPIYGQIGGGTAQFSGNVYSGGQSARVDGSVSTKPQFGVVGSQSGSARIYQRYLRIFIVDRLRSKPNQPFVVFESRALSEGTTGEIAQVMPFIIRAAFSEFPGVSGKTRTVSLPMDSK